MYHRWDIDLGTDLDSSSLCLVVAFCDVFHMLHHEFFLMRVKCMCWYKVKYRECSEGLCWFCKVVIIGCLPISMTSVDLSK